MIYVLGSLFWILLCFVLYWALSERDPSSIYEKRFSISWIMLLAAVVRLCPAILLPTGAEYDIESFKRVAETFLRGEGIYSSSWVAGRHPYLPFQMYLIAGAMSIANFSGLSFVFVIKLIPIIADLALTFIIYKTFVNMHKPAEGFHLAASYALNPVSILVSAYHGQFDALPACLLALSWYFWRFGRGPQFKVWLSAIALGFAILDKTWPAMFLPIAFLKQKSWRGRVLYSLIALSIPVLGVAIYLARFPGDFAPLLRRALTHAGVPGWWGIGALLGIISSMVPWGTNLLQTVSVYSRWIVVLSVGLSYWIARKETAIQMLMMAILTLYAVTIGSGLQWGVWIVPFALLAGDYRWLRVYVATFLVYSLPAYFGYHLDRTLTELIGFQRMAIIMRFCAIPVWLVVIFWLIYRISARRGNPSIEWGE